MWRKSVVVCESRRISVATREWSRRGLPCLMLHGFGDSSGVWNHLAARIAPFLRVAAIDLRGHGDSDWDPEANYDTETFAADLNKTTAALGFEQMVLVGHSLGADVAIRFAAENTARVVALVIVDFGPELDEAGVDEVLRSFACMPRSFRSPEAYAEWLIMQRPLADPNVLRPFARQSLRLSPSQLWELKVDAALANHSQLSKLLTSDGRYCNPDLWRMLTRINCPILVVRGDASGVFPPDTANRMVNGALRNGRLTTVAGAGHAVMMDNPAGFCASVVEFLSGVKAAIERSVA